MRATIAVCVLLATAGSAVALDGEVLLSQRFAMTGGVTPGDAPGFPITITQRGRYKLIGNLMVPAGVSGIEVKQHDVSIDLNGFTIISSPVNAADNGIEAGAVGSLSVMNGTIAGFGNKAINNDAGRSASIENMKLNNNGGRALDLGYAARVSRNVITGNGEAGIVCGSCLIEGNVISDNRGFGIALSSGTILGNTILNNTDFGIWALGPLAKLPGVVGFGNNTLAGNNGGGDQVKSVAGALKPLHPNVCSPAC